MIKSNDLIERFRYALDNKWGYIWGTAGEKWTQAKQVALEKTTDSDRAQGRKYGSKWIGHTVADCSGLFSWAFKKLGSTMYHGSDTMFLKWCVNHGELKKGARTDGKVLKPGTAVFVWNGKKYSHVGLYIGDGVVIEAMGTIQGVTTSKVTATKWSHWGELKDVEFSDSPAPKPEPEPSADRPTIRKGDKGVYVTLAQTELKNKGYDLGKWGVDGDFGSATESAVKAFQKDCGLTPDGIVGKKTWEALDSATPVKLYTVTIQHLTSTEADVVLSKYPTANKSEERR